MLISTVYEILEKCDLPCSSYDFFVQLEKNSFSNEIIAELEERFEEIEEIDEKSFEELENIFTEEFFNKDEY